VHVCRDNLELQYGDKCQILLDSSEADYVSFFDDDDWPAEDFVGAIAEALEERPDYVGFDVKFTEDGVPQAPVHHSLQHPGWHNGSDALYRDIVHFNPILRLLAIQGRWQGGEGADRRWADELRANGCVQTEVYIERELLHYRHVGGCFTIPAPLAEIPPAPQGFDDFVTWLN
jgi:hypothetical protein